jgi:hypothetical protein
VADAVYRHSNGIPRLVNLLCADALIDAKRDGVRQVSPQMIEEAASKIHPGNIKRSRPDLRSDDTTAAELTLLPLRAIQENEGGNGPSPKTAMHHRLRDPERLVSAIGSLNRVSVHSANSVFPWTFRLDRWTRNFTRKRYWVFFSELGLTAALLLTTAEAMTYGAPWPQLAKAVCGFLGLVLTAVFVGTGTFLLIDNCQIWFRSRIALSTIKHLLNGQINEKLIPRISHLREWLQEPL